MVGRKNAATDKNATFQQTDHDDDDDDDDDDDLHDIDDDGDDESNDNVTLSHPVEHPVTTIELYYFFTKSSQRAFS